jgi:uncharacterized membrane protein
MPVFRDERIWRILTNVWTLAFMAFAVANFFAHNRYEALTAPLAVIYTSMLALYVGTKEFDRWYELHESRHPGELFVAGWTLLLLALGAVAFFSDGGYRLDSETVASYIMVLSIFALTQKSKRLHERKRGRGK